MMNKTKSKFSLLAAFLFVITCTTVGQAQSQRTFVAGAGIGTDANVANGCSFTQPCRFFSAAYGVTNAGGEIIALSPGVGYGGLTINKAITVTGLPGQVAFVALGAGGTGFSVAAGVNDLVIIRNLTFNGQNAGGNTGLTHTSGNLVLENCNFSQLTNGLLMNSTNAKGVARNSTFNGNSRGIYVASGTLDVDQCQIAFNSTEGIRADGAGEVSIATVVRVARTDILSNAIGIHMFNAGLRTPGNGACNAKNVFFHTGGVNPHNNNSAGNTTPLLVDGASDLQGACGGNYSIGTYFSKP